MISKIIDFLKSFWYWLFVGLFLLFLFVLKGSSFSQAFYFITFLLPVVIGTSYYVSNKLIPDYFLRKKYGLFILYSIYTIIISLYLQYVIIFVSLLVFTYFQYENQSILTINIGNLSLTFYLFVLIKIMMEILQKLMQKETVINSLLNKSKKITKKNVDTIIIRYNRINHAINLSKIIYIESLSDYIKVVIEEDEIITKEKISKIKERLPDYFIRTHRSFIVNSQKISSYNKEFITLNKYQIPISRTYKKEVVNYLDL